MGAGLEIECFPTELLVGVGEESTSERADERSEGP